MQLCGVMPSAVHFIAVHYSAVIYSAFQGSAIQYCACRYSALEFNAAQCIAVFFICIGATIRTSFSVSRMWDSFSY